MNTIRLSVVLTSELDPAEMHKAAIDALIAPEVPVNVSEDEGIEIL